MQFGHFDHATREYIITNPKTPVKWINYIGTLAFGGFVDHTGGALLCRQDPALNRLTRYISIMPAGEFKGTTLYLRSRRPGGGYQVWSPFFVPCLTPYDTYECHIGLGYTRIISRAYGIECDVTIFVPHGAEVELRRIRITNRGELPLEVDAIPLVEYSHPNALLQLTNADWVPQTMQSCPVEQPGRRLVLLQYPFMRKDTAVNYFTSSHPVDSFETDRRAFLGDSEYGTWAAPLSLQNERLGNSIALRGDNVAALLHHLGPLAPGQTIEFTTQLGQAASLEAAQPSIDRYRNPLEVKEALEGLTAFWDSYLAGLQIETPDPALDAMLNVFNAYQCYTTYNWSRYLSLYQLGYGARGIGFRDSSQDVMGILALAPAEGRDLLRKLLSVQKRNGSAMHQFNPLSLVASEGDSLEREDRPHYYSDDHLWVVQAVTAYLKETGDLDFLEEMIPYYEKDRAGQPLEYGSVFDHLQRAVSFTKADLGAHGLPLLGFADWNDTLNLPRGAESVLAANLYGVALRELSALCDLLDRPDLAKQYRADYTAMQAQVNAEAWDGEWYSSYFDEQGHPLGSRENDAGQIYNYGQSWPIISGFATPERAKSALDAVERLLDTRCGIKLSAPGFNGFDPARGGITTYPPGAKENGGIFLHTNPWIVIAETLTGNGARAYRYYRQVNPAGKNDRIEEYECEPYVYPQNILSDEHPQFGLARNSWLSGTASWMYQAGTQYILGLRAEYDGLRIAPCIPPEWDGFRAVRRFRGITYKIQVHNPRHVSSGVRSLVVDGQALEGSLVPVFPDGEHSVEVELG